MHYVKLQFGNFSDSCIAIQDFKSRLLLIIDRYSIYVTCSLTIQDKNQNQRIWNRPHKNVLQQRSHQLPKEFNVLTQALSRFFSWKDRRWFGTIVSSDISYDIFVINRSSRGFNLTAMLSNSKTKRYKVGWHHSFLSIKGKRNYKTRSRVRIPSKKKFRGFQTEQKVNSPFFLRLISH